jgi:tetratricopeptide (TPR) repeat protein
VPIKIDSRREITQVCFLLLLAAATYANSLLNGFIYDDFQQIVENPYVHSFRHVRAIFATSVWSFQGAEGVLSYYRPLMTFGYMICWRLFGSVPVGYHIVSVAMNGVIVLLVFFLARRLYGDDVVSFVSAAIFALHPVHTESVAWVAGVTDLQLTFFYLLTFWLFLDLTRIGNPGVWVRRILMTASFGLALLSKEQAATLPVLVTLYEHFYRNDRNETTSPQKISRYGMLWALLGVYLLVRSRILGALLPGSRHESISYYEVILSAVSLFGKYMGKLLWPAHLALFYDIHKSTSLFQPGVLLGLASLLFCFALFVWTGMRRPVSFAVVWFLLTLAPVLNIRWMVTNVFAERYLYLPSVGFSWLAAYGVRKLWLLLEMRPAVWRGALACTLGALGLICMIETVRRNLVWRDQETFIRHSVASSSDGSFIRANLGAIDWDRGDVAGAEREWLAAYKERPNNAILLEDLGLLYAKQQRTQEAIAYFQRGIQLQPNYMHAHLSFGKFYEDLGRNADAESEYHTAVQLAPLSIQARNILGELLFNEGRLAEAEQEFQRSIEIDDSDVAFDRLGDINLRWGNGRQAERAYSKAASLNPFDSHAHFRLGELYQTNGRVTEAIREYEAGLETDPNNAEGLKALHILKP